MGSMRKMVWKKVKAASQNQSGAALIIALIMMIALTLIGIASTLTSTFEIKLSGNKRGSTDAFYIADAGLQSVRAITANFLFPNNFTPVSSGNLPVDLQNDAIDSRFTTPGFSLPPGINFTEAPQVTIYHITRAGGEGTQGGWTTNTYIANSIGRDQTEVGLIKPTCQVRAKWIDRSQSEMDN